MTRRGTGARATLALALALMTATTAGCFSYAARGPDTDLETMLATRDDARSRLQQIALAVESAGPIPEAGRGQWTGCNDYGGAWQYEAWATFDTDGPSSGELDEAVAAVTDLTGWSPVVTGHSTSIARGHWDEVSITMHAYDDSPSLGVTVLGPCLTFKDRAPLEQGDRGTQDLDIGATETP